MRRAPPQAQSSLESVDFALALRVQGAIQPSLSFHPGRRLFFLSRACADWPTEMADLPLLRLVSLLHDSLEQGRSLRSAGWSCFRGRRRRISTANIALLARMHAEETRGAGGP